MRFNHVIWDYDGTIFDTYPVMAAAFSTILGEYGFIEPTDTVVSHMKVSMRHTIEYYKACYGLDDVFLERFDTLIGQTAAIPFDGVLGLCRDIKKCGGTNYLFTHRGESAVRYFEKYGLITDFEELITSKQGFQNKPSPDAILYLMDKHSFLSGDAIMIGDRDIDILAAQNAGIHNCYFTDRGGSSAIAEFNIDNFSELYNILGINT